MKAAYSPAEKVCEAHQQLGSPATYGSKVHRSHSNDVLGIRSQTQLDHRDSAADSEEPRVKLLIKNTEDRS
ncbi:MAG: hypothetical protein CMM05_07615 [Rhodopirellula sp.]|nr:hypothetical protein [Rhodopirellula sp.]